MEMEVTRNSKVFKLLSLKMLFRMFNRLLVGTVPYVATSSTSRCEPGVLFVAVINGPMNYTDFEKKKYLLHAKHVRFLECFFSKQ